MNTLNLPSYKYRVKKIDGKPCIFDVLRKKYLVLTPEEWVRQHFTHYLVANGYLQTLISHEKGLTYNNLKKRSDILAYDRTMSPFLLVECKAPHVKLDEQVMKQAAHYNYIIRAKYLAVTNGLQHLYFSINFDTQEVVHLEGLPPFEQD